MSSNVKFFKYCINDNGLYIYNSSNCLTLVFCNKLRHCFNLFPRLFGSATGEEQSSVTESKVDCLSVPPSGFIVNIHRLSVGNLFRFFGLYLFIYFFGLWRLKQFNMNIMWWNSVKWNLLKYLLEIMSVSQNINHHGLSKFYTTFY